MDKHKFFVEKLRFHLKEKDTLVFVGWFFDGSTKDHSLEAYMDGEKLPMELQIKSGSAGAPEVHPQHQSDRRGSGRNRHASSRLAGARSFSSAHLLPGAGDESIPYPACRAFASGAGDQLLC